MNDRPIHLRLPLPLSVNRLWRAGRGRVYRSARYQAWRTEALWLIKTQAQSRKISGGYIISVAFDRPDKRRRDLDNLLKALSDALVEAGVIDDDASAQEIHLRWAGPGNSALVTLTACPEAIKPGRK